MSGILFSHSYFMRFDSKQWRIMQPYPPLATIQSAALMRSGGNEVALFDTMFSSAPEDVITWLEKTKPDFFVLNDDGFNYLTKMCLTNMREAAWKMMHYAGEHGCTVIVSSSDSTDHYEDYLSNGADFVILGETEQTLLELVTALKNGENDFTKINGLAFRNGTEIIRTTYRSIMKELDTLPLPAWDLIDMNEYKKRWKEQWGYFSLNVATTRGCPYKCNWCAKPIYGNTYNMRSPEQVVSELKMLKEKYGMEHTWFCDDIFGLRRSWVTEFADIVKEQGLKLRYKIQSRANLLVEENYVDGLTRSGCETVWMGAESGSQKILDAMDKGITIEQIKRANQLLKSNGMRTAFFLQFGYPGERMEDIQKTIELLNECLPDDIGISISYPLPGTKFYENVKKDMTKKSNWTDSDELMMMFKNEYSPKFYRQLHRFIHKNYRKSQSIDSIKKIFRSPLNVNARILRSAVLSLYYYPVSYIEKRKLYTEWR